ncbi:MAG TPA: ATPase, T2SS/T4P/T4SS family [Acidimicrobiales bacterium]|nr:ATPase, T2SS/T4P/T4SS family [Acidimicrobiales bacterium]
MHPDTRTQMIGAIRAQVADDLADAGIRGLTEDDRRELARQLALERLQAVAADRMLAGQPPLAPLEEQLVAQDVIDALFGLGRLQSLIDDPEVENIDVNGADRVWVTYADGTKRLADPIAESDDELVEVIRSAAARLGLSERRFDNACPELDLRLPDGSRLSAVMAVTARPAVSVRRHRYVDLTLADLVSLGAMDDAVADFLAAAVRARKNIVVAGAMNSGKTTLVRALASEIPARERVVTIEQAFELGLDTMGERHPDLVALEARSANAEGEGQVSMARLVRRALRMNADRVIVGEVLGDEVLPMLNAMSQGRSGSMCTIHADSSAGAFRRLASYAVQAPERLPLESTNLLIAGAVHFVVYVEVAEEPSGRPGTELERLAQMGTTPADSNSAFTAVRRRRFVSSIREVVDADGLQVISNEVFTPGADGRAVPSAPLRSSTLADLAAKGYEPSWTRVESRSWS